MGCTSKFISIGISLIIIPTRLNKATSIATALSDSRLEDTPSTTKCTSYPCSKRSTAVWKTQTWVSIPRRRICKQRAACETCQIVRRRIASEVHKYSSRSVYYDTRSHKKKQQPALHDKLLSIQRYMAGLMS